MNPYNLKNNAMFLACWHERNRPVQLTCFAILIASVLVLSFISISINERRPEKIWEALFYVIVGVQAMVLLLEGSVFVGYLASRERTSETLDFHRNSPQPVMEKILGLILGGTWFEWLVFAILFIVQLPFALLPHFSLMGIFLFNASLLLTGILFQTSAATFSLVYPQKKRGNPVLIILLMLMFVGPALGAMASSTQSGFFAHLFGLTAIPHISHDQPNLFMARWFYTFQLPLIVMQALVQIPIILLLIRGMKRIFSLANSPAWAKEDVIRFFSFLFFMITGFFVATYTHFDSVYPQAGGYRPYYLTLERFLEQGTITYICLFGAVGFLIGFFTVPSYFKRSKYEILCKKTSRKLNSLFDDGATSLPTILIYLGISGLCMVPYLVIPQIEPYRAWYALIMLGSHIIAFAGFLEFFRLGRFRGNKIFFVTTLIVWWVFVPWLASAIYNFRFEEIVNVASLSPFVGFAYSAAMLTESKEKLTLIPLIAPCIAAVATWLLASQEHRAIQKTIKG